MNNASQAILFYDGNCGLCNRVVQFVLRFEKEQVLHFASLDSQFAKDFFNENGGFMPDDSTVIFYSNYQMYQRSAAVIQLLSYLKFPFPLLKVFKLLPVCWRDRLYTFVATNRNRLFKPYCVLPTVDQNRRFIS